jgi:sugar lactone lactonase YvrE
MFRIHVGFCSLWLTAGLASAGAQQYGISTYAGGAAVSPSAAISMAADPSGNLYFADGYGYSNSPARSNSVFKIDPSGVITRFAGNSRTGFSGDGGQAAGATLTGPRGVAADSAGNVFIVDAGNQRVRRVSADGIITTVAGGGSAVLGDGGAATAGQLNYPQSIAVDGRGSLFVGEYGRVRRISADGIITTVAGGGPDAPGAGGPATGVRLSTVVRVAVDGSGNLFLADQAYDQETDEYGYSLRKVSPDGLISTLPPIRFCCSLDMIADGAGNLLLIAGGSNVWKIAPNGARTVVAGNGTYGFSTVGELATQSPLNGPTALALNSAGELFIADNAGRTVRKVTTDGNIRSVFSIPRQPPTVSGDAGPATGVELQLAFSGLLTQSGLAVDRAGNLYIAETAAHRVRKVAPSGIITTVAGTGAQRCYSQSDCFPLGDGGPATGAALYFPTSVAVDSAGNLFIADSSNLRVRKVSPDGIITTVAGNGTAPVWPRAANDGVPATDAAIMPSHVMVDGAGNLYITEAQYADVRKVSPDGTLHTAVPSQTGLAYYGFISASTVDQAGSVFVAGGVCDGDDQCPHSIRKFSPSGVITTVATWRSLSREPGSDVGDGGPVAQARLGFISSLAVDSVGNLIIGDLFGQRVRKLDLNGIITTVGGNGIPGYSGDGGPGANATLDHPLALAADGAGNVYVSDFNQSVRLLRPVAQ